MRKRLSNDLLLRQEILRDKPIGYWPLGESAFAVDYRPGSSPANGSFNGTIADAAGVCGGRSKLFDGSTGYVDSGAALGVNHFTLIGFGYKTATGAATVLGQGNNSAADFSYYMRIGSGAGFTNGSGAFNEVTVPDCSLNGWHLHAVTFDGAAITYWRDGQFVATAANSNSPEVLTNHCIIGRLGDFSGQYWPGRLAHVAVFNYALSPARIAQYWKIAGLRTTPRYRRVGFFTKIFPILRIFAPEEHDPAVQRFYSPLHPPQDALKAAGGYGVQLQQGGAEVQSFRVIGAVPGTVITDVAGRCTSGAGTLTCSNGVISWQAPGSTTAGSGVAVPVDGNYLLKDGSEPSLWIKVQVYAAFLSTSAQATVYLGDRYNVLGPDDVSAANATAGIIETTQYTLNNVLTTPALNVKLWLDSAAGGAATLSVSKDNVTYTSPHGEADTGALSWSSIAAGGSANVWIRRTIPAGAGYSPKVTNVVRWAWDGTVA
jgi:hypothetical protein